MLRLTSSRMEPNPAAPRGNAAALDGEWGPRIREEMETKRRLESRGIHNITWPEEVNSSEYSGGDMTALISPASRSMSDITPVTRHRPPAVRNQGEKEERAKQMWLPIARRTVEWFAGKERGSMLQPIPTGDGVEKV
ncbi:hypothetical protein HPP92_008137 [Vanilla planifolia]|uniref:Uncharacterized protein n=1 Tax=Vanilla planifolia TaxID=51239 RepID=A0A835VAQ3_VANPL|nr:hypothetical protein HPP92_008137 [Vanilla planifolia]